MKKKRKGFFLSRLYIVTGITAIVFLVILGVAASSYSYALTETRLLSQADEIIEHIVQYYEGKVSSFARLYLPSFRNETFTATAKDFYAAQTPLEIHNSRMRRDLLGLLAITAQQDPEIEWIVVYNSAADIGFVYDAKSKDFLELDESFPFLENIRNKQYRWQLSETKAKRFGTQQKTFAIMGGSYAVEDPILANTMSVGYDVSLLDRITAQYKSSISTRFLLTTTDGGVIYDSAQEGYGMPLGYAVQDPAQKNPVRGSDGVLYYARHIVKPGTGYVATYLIPWKTLFFAANANTPLIVAVVVLFLAISLLAYMLAKKMTWKRVKIINNGLAEIERDLEYQIPFEATPDEFAAISTAINKMTAQIREYIKKIYLYEIDRRTFQLRQKTAKMMELQSKFNPHFLYNCLEMIRVKLYNNNDYDTAQLVVALSRIFRNLVGGKVFVTIREEIDFCMLYIKLFSAQYADLISVRFDIQTETLSCGIIRNLLQPLVENYFVHGFNPQIADNRIEIWSKTVDDRFIELGVANNGNKITPDRMAEIHRLLSAETDDDSDSHGLAILKDQIVLFYGEGCGLIIENPRDSEGDLCVRIRIRNMSVEEHVDAMEGSDIILP